MTSQQFTPDNVTFSRILTIENRKIGYTIPPYQRGYIWGNKQWEELWSEIYNEEIGVIQNNNFLGAIICIQNTTGTEAITWREVVDGQQRITTLTLLFIAIWKKLGSIVEDELKKELSEISFSDEFKTALSDIKRMLFMSDNVDNPMPRLQPARIADDDKVFKKILQTLVDYSTIVTEIYKYHESAKTKIAFPTLIRTTNSPINNSFTYEKSKIYECLVYFEKQIPNNVDDILKIYNCVKNMRFVLLLASAEEDAYQLFQVLNDRGVDLSSVDVIKSYLFAGLNQSDAELASRHEQWIEMQKILGSTAIQERYLRHLYNAHLRFEYKIEDKILDQTRVTTLKSDYRYLISKFDNATMDKFYDSIIENGQLYKEISNPVDVVSTGGFLTDSDKIKFRLKDLKNIEAATSYLLLLYLKIEQNNDRLEFTDAEYLELLDFLCAYYVRRNIMGQPTTNKMDPLVVTLVHDLCQPSFIGSIKNLLASNIDKKSQWKIVFDKIKDSYLNRNRYKIATWDEFAAELATIDMYAKQRDILDFMFTRIEENTNNRLARVDWQIEHIHPQNPRQGVEKWPNHVGKLGNLTLTLYNQNLSNKDFKTKRDFKDKHGVLRGYSAGVIYLNTNIRFGINSEFILAIAPDWTKEYVDQRTTSIILELKKFLRFPDEQ
jgi:uncharacterized protein with ParB-like and HNH nuclease domain